MRKAGRDLAANVSLYGWAGTNLAAERLKAHIRTALEILERPEIRRIYGVTTPWQVIERVAANEFGQAPNVVKFRTKADSGKKILGIIAAKHNVWSLSGVRELFTELLPGGGGRVGDLNEEATRDLMRQVQYWLAVSGINDEQVDRYRQPVETVAAPSLPNFGGDGAGAVAGGGIDQLREMIAQGESPSLDQLKALLPSF